LAELPAPSQAKANWISGHILLLTHIRVHKAEDASVLAGQFQGGRVHPMLHSAKAAKENDHKAIIGHFAVKIGATLAQGW
jgi:hypothetical protein